MIFTFDNIMEQVVNSRTISRKEKQHILNRFLREHSGENKPTSPEQLEILEKLRAIKKTYSQKDAGEKTKRTIE